MIYGSEPNRAQRYADNRWTLKAPHLNEKVLEQARAIRDFHKATKGRIGPMDGAAEEEDAGASAVKQASEEVSSMRSNISDAAEAMAHAKGIHQAGASRPGVGAAPPQRALPSGPSSPPPPGSLPVTPSGPNPPSVPPSGGGGGGGGAPPAPPSKPTPIPPSGGAPAPGQGRRVKVINRDAEGNETDAYRPPGPRPVHKTAPPPTGNRVQDILNKVGVAAENKVADAQHWLDNPKVVPAPGGKEPTSLTEHLMQGAFGGHGGNIIYHPDAAINPKTGERRIATQNTGNGTQRRWVEYNADSGVVPPTHEESAPKAPAPSGPGSDIEQGEPSSGIKWSAEQMSDQRGLPPVPPGAMGAGFARGEVRSTVPASRAIASGPSDPKGSYDRTAKAFQQAERAKRAYHKAVRAHYTGPRGPSFIERHINGGVVPGPKHHLRAAYDAMHAAGLAAQTAHLAHASRHGDVSANDAMNEGIGRAA